MYQSKSMAELDKYNKMLQNQRLFQLEKVKTYITQDKEHNEVLERQFQIQNKIKTIEDICTNKKSYLV